MVWSFCSSGGLGPSTRRFQCKTCISLLQTRNEWTNYGSKRGKLTDFWTKSLSSDLFSSTSHLVLGSVVCFLLSYCRHTHTNTRWDYGLLCLWYVYWHNVWLSCRYTVFVDVVIPCYSFRVLVKTDVDDLCVLLLYVPEGLLHLSKTKYDFAVAFVLMFVVSYRFVSIHGVRPLRPCKLSIWTQVFVETSVDPSCGSVRRLSDYLTTLFRRNR